MSVAAAMLVGVPHAALAQQIGPADDQYDPTSELIQGSVDDQSSTTGDGCDPGDGSSTAVDDPECRDQSRVASELPFTGLDVGLFVAVGTLLAAGGFALRRVARSR